jgi:Ca-activated chloride channel family protein
MKKLLLCTLFSVLCAAPVFANGVAVYDAVTGIYLKTVSSDVAVAVENQASITKVTQMFQNNLGKTVKVKYAFPLPEVASATQLKWKINNVWYQAKMAATPQDTSLPGSGGTKNANLVSFLGKTPLYFDIQQEVPKDSTLTFELTYVELLKYENGNVTYTYPNDYRLIQATAFVLQNFQFTLNSSRTITAINLTSHTAVSNTNTGNQATVTYTSEMNLPDKNYSVQYSLSLNQLGLFSLSTKLPDSLVPDKYGNGFFLFVAEPDPSANTKVIKKVFTLIIDRSGSMSGTKMEQAKNAATFIVNNLNPGDKFNIVDFSDVISSFRSSQVDFNATNQAAALTYISGLAAGGSTDIAASFDRAIADFSTSATDSTANIVIFFTDGQPTAGITTTDGILGQIKADVAASKKKISVFTFGIGSDVNTQLLSLIATQNNGLAQFLGNDQLESSITSFYTKIRNPVLLKTQVAFSPAIISNVYPLPLPNLYKGQQMILVGRYATAGQVQTTFSGEAFGSPVSYQYSVNLADSAVDKNQFILKIWAKQKMDNLLSIYYTLDPNSQQAQEFKSEIVNLSMQYGIVSPFTSFSSNPTPVEKGSVAAANHASTPAVRVIHGANGSVRLQFAVAADLHRVVTVRIFDAGGRLVRTLYLTVTGQGMYELTWDGMLDNGRHAPNDVYFCVIDLGNKRLDTKIVLMK